MITDNHFDHLKSIAAQLLQKADDLLTIISKFKGNALEQITVRTMTDIEKISASISTLKLEIQTLILETLPTLENEPINTTKKLIDIRHKFRMLISLIKGYSEIVIDDLQTSQDKFLITQFIQIITVCKQAILFIDQLRESKEKVFEKQLGESDWRKMQEKASNINSILIVDDSEQNCGLLNNLLQRKKYDTFVARSGKEALMQLEAHPDIDIVLLDVMMPLMDGYEVLLRIKQDARFAHTMVIMISGLDELDAIVRCIMGGAEDYLIKPFNPYILSARIYACSEKKRFRNMEESYLDDFAFILSMMNILAK
jgi:adenylate cyclase